MRRIAASVVGGMVSARILTLIVIPALFLIWRGRTLVESFAREAGSTGA